MPLLLALAARRNIFMLVQMRVSILLFLAGLASVGMAVVETVQLTSVPEHTRKSTCYKYDTNYVQLYRQLFLLNNGQITYCIHIS